MVSPVRGLVSEPGRSRSSVSPRSSSLRRLAGAEAVWWCRRRRASSPARAAGGGLGVVLGLGAGPCVGSSRQVVARSAISAATSSAKSSTDSKRLVDAGEAQVGDLVERAQRLEHREAHRRRPDLGATPAARSASSTAWPSRARSSSVTGRPLQALRTPVDDLVAVERLGRAGLLHHGELDLLHGGEPPVAGLAGPAAPDRPAVVGDARVEHPGVGVLAVRAVHRVPPLRNAGLGPKAQLVDNSHVCNY